MATAKKTTKKKAEDKAFNITPPRVGFLYAVVGAPKDVPGVICNRKGPELIEYLRLRALGDNSPEHKRKMAEYSKRQRIPEKEFTEAMYPTSNWTKKKPQYGLRASGFSKAMERAAELIPELAMSAIRRHVTVISTPGESNLVVMTKHDEPIMREDLVEIGTGTTKTPDLRWRPEFKNWEAEVCVRYNADFISGEQVANLLARAGMLIGWGDWRLEKGGEFGCFEIKRDVRCIEDAAQPVKIKRG